MAKKQATSSKRIARRQMKYRGFGTIERLEHQVTWELAYSGLLEELAELPATARAKRFDRLWGAFTRIMRAKCVGEPGVACLSVRPH